MKRPLKPEEARLWSVVASTVRPAKGRSHPKPAPEVESDRTSPLAAARAEPRPESPQAQVGLSPRGEAERKGEAHRQTRPLRRAPEAIEPLRKRRIVRERDPIEARLDLHGLDQDRARLALHGFLRRAHAEGLRAVLVITGKGALGDGVLRRRTPDWLAESEVRALIAGFSPAERRHGGEGALYVALKRRLG